MLTNLYKKSLLGRYGHAITVRDCRTGLGQAYQYELPKHVDIPIISMQDDIDHPCQALADLLTIREKLGSDLRGRKFVIISWTDAPKYVRPLSVPQAVVNEILKHPDQLGLGGDRRILTILFSDIRGFTAIAEQTEPEVLVDLLHSFLNPMSADYQGARGHH